MKFPSPYDCFLVRLALPLLLACVGTLPCDAISRTVTTTADDNDPGSLRGEILLANNGDTIVIPPTLGTTITLTLGELVVNKNIQILGPSPSAFSVVNFSGRVFHFARTLDPVIAGISGLQITGKVTGTAGADGSALSPDGTNAGDAKGGGVLVEAACTVTITNCFFNGCQVIGGNGGHGYNDPDPLSKIDSNGGYGGGVCGGGACNTAGDLFLYSCTFANNSVIAGNGGNGYHGGRGGSGGKAQGGGMCTEYGTDLVVVNCTFHQNTATGGNGGAGGDSQFENGGNGGGGGNAEGGGIVLEFASPNQDSPGFIHDTIVGNRILPGQGGKGGLAINGGASGTSYVNGTARGGGISRTDMDPMRYMPIGNTIIAENVVTWRFNVGSFPVEGPDIRGTMKSRFYNLFGKIDGHSLGWSAAMDLLGNLTLPLSPLLGQLQLNAGQTPTMAPRACSPVIDRGTQGDLAQDQANQARPVIVTSGNLLGDGSDIGAYELQIYPLESNPVLTIERVGNSIVLRWPEDASCYILQQSATLLNDWVDGPASTVSGAFREVVIFPLVDKMFYRLKHL